MVEITDLEYEQFKLLKRVWQDINAERTGGYFICGSTTDRDEYGLPEYIQVCPASGLNYSVMYKREK
jgi:hypothetical protein